MKNSLRSCLRVLCVVSFLSASFAGRALAAALQAPAGDAFYTPPSPLPAVPPGAPIWYRSSTFGTNTAIAAWQVLYRSSSALDVANAVSGTLLVPTASYTGGGARPLISFAVGTQGLGDACAPSKAIVNGSLYEAAIITDALNRGWAVVLSDYEGLGTPGDHTYVVNLSLGHAVLDAARAAQQIPEAGLGAGNPIALWGYSEGGGAAAAAAELQATYAPELNVIAAAAGAAPSDLVRAGQYQDGQIGFGSVFAAGIGFDAAYSEIGLTSYLNDAGKTARAQAREMCIVSLVATFAGHHMSEYTTQDPLTVPAFRARLEENHLGKRKPRMPVYLYHMEGDEVIPFDSGVALRDHYCALGANVTWKGYPGGEHITGQVLGFGEAEAWLAARFAGESTTGTCPAPPPDAGAGGTGSGGAGPGDPTGCQCRLAQPTRREPWLLTGLAVGLVLLRRAYARSKH